MKPVKKAWHAIKAEASIHHLCFQRSARQVTFLRHKMPRTLVHNDATYVLKEKIAAGAARMVVEGQPDFA